MAISKVEKVLIALHKTEREDFLSRLQDKGILHITEIKEKEEPAREEIETSARIAWLERVIKYLRPYTKESFIDSLFGNKRIIAKDLYNKTTGSSEYENMAGDVRELEKRESEIKREKTQHNTQIEELNHWRNLETPLNELMGFKEVLIETGFIPKTSLNTLKNLPDFIEVEIVTQEKEGAYCIFAYKKEQKEDAKVWLSTIAFEPIRLTEFTGKPSEIVKELNKKIEALDLEEEKIKKRVLDVAENIERILILYDENYNASLREKATSSALITQSAICIEGWVRKNDRETLKKLADEFNTVTLETIKPKKGETPPSELENRPPIRPFEALVRLYGMPHSGEIDPTPIIAPFFVVFFAFCLSDAMYGVIFAVTCFIFMKKITGDKSLLRVLTWGAIATVVIGILLGGWFGDLPQRISPVFSRTREKLMLFDPMNEPLKFFILALGIGVFQILTGFFIGFINLIRQKKILLALSSKLSWDIFWLSLFLFIGASYIPSIEGMKNLFLIPLTASILLVIFASGIPSRSWFIQIAKGLFNLYQGIMGTVGDIISYSRLMALGLVTMGLAMAVNILVDVMAQIPIAKFVLVPLVFIGGHLFSIGINVLGAYVHTLRLQYAEFFTKFFEGGGKPFSPLKRETRYVMVQDTHV